MDRDKVWVGDPKAGFILGRIVEIGNDGPIVQPQNRALSPLQTSYDSLYPAEEDERKEVDDNCSLMYLNEATLLHNVKLRYSCDKIYTYVANILIAVNPYKDIKNLYSSSTIKSYEGKSLGTMPPHVFAIADKAFRDMKVVKQSQSVIVSGESGAGKTESTKYILNYLCSNFGQSAGALESKILNANPILEAFGNAKTTRNNNSSRFGKFIEIHFDGRCQVVGGYISHYLLERARVVHQNNQERNYHIFYQLCAGATDEMRRQLRLGSPDNFRYLSECSQYFLSRQTESQVSSDRLSNQHKKKGALKDAMLDDYKNFQSLDRDLGNIGLSSGDRMSVYTTIAAILHIGNISFEDDPDDNRGGCRVTDKSEQSLQTTADLMGLDCDELRRALTARVMQATKGGYKGTVIMVPLKVHEASSARDALSKALYSHVFDYIVHRINQSIPFKSSAYYIGVLDIAGFEYFAVNSFEQFCINYCNEKLQQFFNQRILKDEQSLYAKEGLGVKSVHFVDNQDCIDLIETKGTGIFSLLDEESKLPKPNCQHFTSAAHNNNGNHFRLSLPRKSKLKEHREIRDEDGFLIRHFAGAVCYTTKHFIEKNNDALHASLEMVALECKNKFIQKLFQKASNSENRGKLNFISVGSKFKTQLGELMEKLRSTGTNFIRCIKPNVKMVENMFDGGSVLSQLQCAGMTSVLELMQQGFPSRAPFSELYNMYKAILPPDLARLDPRLFCKALFKALGLNDNDFKFGMTKVFFRPGKFAEFDTLMRSDPQHLKVLVGRVKKWLIRSHWKKAQWCSLSVIKLTNKILFRREALITIQKTVRMHQARKKYKPRYEMLMKINQLSSQLQKLGTMGRNIKTEKDSGETSKAVQKIESNIKVVTMKIKTEDSIRKKDLEKYYQSLVDQINAELANVKKKIEKQKAAEEQEKLRKLQREMEEQRKKKEAEEAEVRRMEEERKLKADMEIKRKQEEEKRRRQDDSDQAKLSSMQKALEHADARLAEQREQERRDHELAVRLAEETGGGVEELSLKRSSLVTAQREAAANKKYDLSKWKYAELRDTINTSCDIELLEACREEFHRRLKVYHAWKARNKKKNSTFDEEMRAPSSVTEQAGKAGAQAAAKKSVTSTDQRYFRVPFVRPNSVDNVRGWWYAHFDGDWIARQMEIHPGREPILLLAGRDDMQMCELSLDETGLTRKRGAEILEHEFDKEWETNGGKQYTRPADRRNNGRA